MDTSRKILGPLKNPYKYAVLLYRNGCWETTYFGNNERNCKLSLRSQAKKIKWLPHLYDVPYRLIKFYYESFEPDIILQGDLKEWI